MNNRIIFPKNLSEALKIITEQKNILPIAGGTSILPTISSDIDLLDLEPLGLNYIKKSKGKLKIGAMTTINELIDSILVKKYLNGIICDASLTIASTPNRNLITVGGNIVGLRPWSVIPGLLLLLEGRVLTVKKRVIKAEELFSSLPKNVLGKDIVVEVEFQELKENILSYWKKFSLTETDYPIVSVGIICETKGKIIKNIRIVAIGLTLFPQRFKVVEKFLQNKKLSLQLVDNVLKQLESQVKVSNDIRVSTDYKKEIFLVLVKEFLEKLV
jgi:carbon-monoxide dehydrogenase medium subunit